MPRFCPALFLSALLLSCATAGGSPAADSPVLPLRTLRIYESGVGYFARTGRLSRSSATTLPVPASHLDDALKTLVILNNKGEGNVQGLEFGSRLSQGMARAQAGLPMDANTPTTYRTLLVSSIDSMKKEVAEVEKDLERLRKHLEALGDGGEGATRFVKRILAGEDRLSELRRRQAARAKDVETLRTSLRAALEKLAEA